MSGWNWLIICWMFYDLAQFMQNWTLISSEQHALPPNRSGKFSSYLRYSGEWRLLPHIGLHDQLLIFWHISQNADFQYNYNLAAPPPSEVLWFLVNIVVHLDYMTLKAQWWSGYSAPVPNNKLQTFWQSEPWWLSLHLLTPERTIHIVKFCEYEHILYNGCKNYYQTSLSNAWSSPRGAILIFSI